MKAKDAIAKTKAQQELNKKQANALAKKQIQEDAETRAKLKKELREHRRIIDDRIEKAIAENYATYGVPYKCGNNQSGAILAELLQTAYEKDGFQVTRDYTSQYKDGDGYEWGDTHYFIRIKWTKNKED